MDMLVSDILKAFSLKDLKCAINVMILLEQNNKTLEDLKVFATDVGSNIYGKMTHAEVLRLTPGQKLERQKFRREQWKNASSGRIRP